MNTDVWTNALRTRAIKIRNELDALDNEIVLAHKDGLPWRTIGDAAGINHEKARQAQARIDKRDQRKPLPELHPAEPDGP
jgi:hypothetical protein